MKHRISDQIIWVTGASSGIGRDLALELARLGNLVYASGRNLKALDELAAADRGIRALPVDVSDRDAVLEASDTIKVNDGRLDVAVLNAGTCEYVDAAHFDSRLVERVMHVNFDGLVYCVEAALPLLRRSQSPYLVGMSSTVAFAALPRAEAYGASKVAIHYFLDSLRADVKKEGIDISIICPGFVKTPLTDKNDFPMPMRITVAESTRHIIKGMQKRKQEITYPKLFSYCLKLLGLLPRWIRNRIMASMVAPEKAEATA